MWPFSTIAKLRKELAAKDARLDTLHRMRDDAVDQARLVNATNRTLATQRDEALRLQAETRSLLDKVNTELAGAQAGHDVLEGRIADLLKERAELQRQVDQDGVLIFDLQKQLEEASRNDHRDARGRFAKAT